MSCDLLEDCEDKTGSILNLAMFSSGFARLYVISENNNIHDFELTPDKQGFENAEKIISALQEWVRHNNG
jgi:hypothetical protein